jgi:hypothetical protein
MYCSLVRGQRWWALFCRHGGPEDVSTVQLGLLGCWKVGGMVVPALRDGEGERKRDTGSRD